MINPDRWIGKIIIIILLSIYNLSIFKTANPLFKTNSS